MADMSVPDPKRTFRCQKFLALGFNRYNGQQTHLTFLFYYIITQFKIERTEVSSFLGIFRYFPLTTGLALRGFTTILSRKGEPLENGDAKPRIRHEQVLTGRVAEGKKSPHLE